MYSSSRFICGNMKIHPKAGRFFFMYWQIKQIWPSGPEELNWGTRVHKL